MSTDLQTNPVEPPNGSNAGVDGFLRAAIFVAFAFSGAAALAYEVVWTRKLSTIMGSSTYAISTILAAFMTGLAIGSMLGGWLTSKVKRPLMAFALFEILIGLSALAVFPIIKASAPIYIKAYFLFHNSFSAFSISQFAIVFSLILIPTTLMGMTFPFVIKIFENAQRELARTAGFLYGFNTLGAVLGSMGAGFFLIPYLGAKGAVTVAAGLNLLGGLTLLFFSMKRNTLNVALTAGALPALMLPTWLDRVEVPFISNYSAHRFGDYRMANMVMDAIDHAGAEHVVVYHHEGVESDVFLMRDDHMGELVLANGGKLEGGENSPGFVLLAYLPRFTRGLGAGETQALNIGLGTGVTLAHLAEPNGYRVDSVELSEGVLEANRKFLKPQLFEDPDIRHIRADGRNYLMLHEEKRYDLIIVSPSWAVETASAGLLTDEFFALAAQRLDERGAISVWLDRFVMPQDDLEIVYRTFSRHFDYAAAWEVQPGGIVLVGSHQRPARGDPVIQRAIERHDRRLRRNFRLAMDDAAIDALGEGAINTDDHPIIEFHNAGHIITGLKRIDGPITAPHEH